MKTKIFSAIFLIIGINIISFSQEEITIKQVLKNSSTSSKFVKDEINMVRINTSLPVTINGGEQNAIYLTGTFGSEEDYAGFCTLEDGILNINSPQKGKNITLELAQDVNIFHFKNNANVLVNKDIDVKKYGLFEIGNNSIAMINSNIKGENLIIKSRNNSKISFYSIDIKDLDIKQEKGSEVFLNGKTNTLKLDSDEDSKLINDVFFYSDLYEAIKPSGGDTILAHGNVLYKLKSSNFEMDSEGNIISNKGDTISKNKNLSKLEDIDTKEEETRCKPYPNVSVVLAASFGILNWSDRVSNIDDLFSSPTNEYDLVWGMSPSIGLTLKYNPNKKISFSTGLLVEFNKFQFQNNVMMTNINGEKRLAYETNPAINATSYLYAYYINIPLTVKYNFYKNFSIHAGGIFGFNFRNSSTGFRREYDIPNAEVIERWGTNYNNFKPIKFEAQAGIGWNGIDLYVKYALTPIFKDNTEREVYPFSIGLSTGF